MVRTVLLAADSLAEILARSRFGITMAAMSGMNKRLIYPKISPVYAIPSPCKCPMLFLIFDREMWPRIIAGIPARNERHSTNEAIPRTMLAIAPPSVFTG